MTSLGIGGVVGGKMLNSGRRMPMILMNILGIIGCFLSIYPNFYVLLAGRACYCIAAGVLIVIVPRILEETIPTKYTPEGGVETNYYDKGFGASTNLAIDGLIMINTILVMVMPKALNPKE